MSKYSFVLTINSPAESKDLSPEELAQYISLAVERQGIVSVQDISGIDMESI